VGDLVLQALLLAALLAQQRALSRNAMYCRTVTSVVTTTGGDHDQPAGPAQRPAGHRDQRTSTAATARYGSSVFRAGGPRRSCAPATATARRARPAPAPAHDHAWAGTLPAYPYRTASAGDRGGGQPHQRDQPDGGANDRTPTMDDTW